VSKVGEERLGSLNESTFPLLCMNENVMKEYFGNPGGLRKSSLEFAARKPALRDDEAI
jgi:hypothetical protein